MFIALPALLTSFMALMASPPKTNKKGSPKKKSGSPTKRNVNQIMKIANSKQMRQLVYYLKIIKLRPDIEIIWVERSPGQDGYMYNVIRAIDNTEDFRDQGLLMSARRRVSQTNNGIMFNAQDSYPRKILIRVVDGSTPESRRNVLMILRDFMMHPENNRFNYEYTVDDSSDLTPHDEETHETADHYIQDNVIVNLIGGIFEETGPNWYAENQAEADKWFEGPVYPNYAVETLGYPNNNQGNGQAGQYAPGFHPANENAHVWIMWFLVW